MSKIVPLVSIVPGTRHEAIKLAQLHFALTEVSAANCRASGVIGEVHTTGNTVIDAQVSITDASKALSKLQWRAHRSLKDMCVDAWRWQTLNPNGHKY